MDGEQKMATIITVALAIIIATAVILAIAVPVSVLQGRGRAVDIAAIEAGLVQCRTALVGNDYAPTLWIEKGTCLLGE